MTTALLSIDCGIIAEDGRITVPIHPDHASILTDPMRNLTNQLIHLSHLQPSTVARVFTSY